MNAPTTHPNVPPLTLFQISLCGLRCVTKFGCVLEYNAVRTGCAIGLCLAASGKSPFAYDAIQWKISTKQFVRM